jgi:hypothetical protein
MSESARIVLTKIRGVLLSFSWQSVIWGINGFFLLTTVTFAYLPHSSSPSRQGLVTYLAQFTLAEERNLATYWEGWCLLLVAVLAFERFLHSDKTATYERQSWIGLAILACGLSLDELGSIHERACFLFSSWGFSESMTCLVPLAVPALLILGFTLHRMYHHTNRRCFRLTLGAFLILGSVALQENLEHTLTWPWWSRGVRVGVEEGCELVGVFLLLSAVLSATADLEEVKSSADLAPRAETLIRLKAVLIFLTLLGFVPLGVLTVLVTTQETHRGVPAAWLPFVLLNLASISAYACAKLDETYRKRFLLASLLTLFFSMDQIIVFQRVIDKNLVRGEVENLIFPSIAALCMLIPILRTRSNILLLGLLLPLSLLLIPPSELFPRLVVPLQSLGIFCVLVSGLAAVRAAAPGFIKARVW